jgi:glycosyltransferase involved in cell wall biosynthesis
MIHPLALQRILRQEAAKWGVHPNDLPSPTRLKRYLYEIETADVVAVPSEFVRKTHVERGVPEHKLHVIPYGADMRRFHPNPDPPTAHPFRVVFTGNFSIRKGAPYILEAWEQTGWRDAELWIVGHIDPEVRQIIHQRWPNLPNVCYLGYHPNLPELYHQVDVQWPVLCRSLSRRIVAQWRGRASMAK